jgi:hypothetical protein
MMNNRKKQRPAKDGKVTLSTCREKTGKTGLGLLLRERKPSGGFVTLAKYVKFKSVAA